MHTELPDGPATRITRLIERMGRLTRARESGSGELNPAQWEALRFLARANSWSRQPSQVARWIASSKGTTSQTLASLERKGLIARRKNPDDRRGVLLELTERGRALVSQDPLSDLSRSIGRLPPLHTAALSQSLVQILSDLAGEQAQPGFDTCRSCRHFRAGETAPTCARFGALASEDLTAICAHSEA